MEKVEKEINDEKKNKKRIVTIIVVVLLATIGFTLAYLMNQIGPRVTAIFNLASDPLDSFTFNTGSAINVKATQQNFGRNAGNQTGSTTATATLTSGNNGTSITKTYNVYLRINSNDFIYTTAPTNTPEIMLKVTNPNNTLVTSINGLTYTTSGGISGFDITTKTGLITLASDYSITTTNTKTDTWTVEVYLINLDTSQKANANHELVAEVIIQEEALEIPDFSTTITYSGDKSNLKFANATKTLNCFGNSWDNKLGGFTASLTGKSPTVECSISATNNANTTYLNSYITSLAGTNQGDGQVVNENGYRYEGKNPNNYVWFNDELWRIIGVFDSSSHGQSGKNLVKIIRANSIGGLVWDKYYNDWPNSSLKALLNGAYYDWNTNSASAATNCYGYSWSITTTFDYSKKGIQDGYRSMIENVTWYLGGGGASGYTDYTPDSIYGYERNSASIYTGRSASTTGYIGLMYESDYLYAVLSSSCARTTAHGSYNTAACGGSNWLYGNSYEWTITPNSSDSDRVWHVNSYGNVGYTSAKRGSAVRPVLYLSSSVYKIDGDGSINNPYIIGM